MAPLICGFHFQLEFDLLKIHGDFCWCFFDQKQKHFSAPKTSLGQYFLFIFFFGGGVINSVWIHIDRRLLWKIMLGHACFFLNYCLFSDMIHTFQCSKHTFFLPYAKPLFLKLFLKFLYKKRCCPESSKCVIGLFPPFTPQQEPLKNPVEVLLFS